MIARLNPQLFIWNRLHTHRGVQADGVGHTAAVVGALTFIDIFAHLERRDKREDAKPSAEVG